MSVKVLMMPEVPVMLEMMLEAMLGLADTDGRILFGSIRSPR